MYAKFVLTDLHVHVTFKTYYLCHGYVIQHIHVVDMALTLGWVCIAVVYSRRLLLQGRLSNTAELDLKSITQIPG